MRQLTQGFFRINVSGSSTEFHKLFNVTLDIQIEVGMINTNGEKLTGLIQYHNARFWPLLCSGPAVSHCVNGGVFCCGSWITGAFDRPFRLTASLWHSGFATMLN